METHHHQCWHGSIFLGHPLPPPQPSSWRPLLARPFSPSLVYCSSNNFPRWDSNAETFRPRNFSSNGARGKEREQEQEEGYGKKRRWWSDENRELQEEEEEKRSSGIWEEATESVWIVKIFKSYGWTLPVILTSWLLASGPKAFLMALVLPLGQSALALAFEKLWGQSESKPKRKHRTRRKPRPRNSARVEEEPEENQKTRKGYQSWVVENNGSGQETAPSFGGWDDLERSRPATKSYRAMDGSRRMPMEAGRLSKRERKSDTPLLLRLLIAVFPFLGTWTKML
ncbi:hypothetical protein E2542_SST25205 [Spatholobus suberectus]|nr:hypothetical protein E2542_SST25205 [Spatholobus suberectus]